MQGLPPGGAVLPAGKAQLEQIGLGQRRGRLFGRGRAVLHRGARPLQGLAQHRELHALHPQLALFGGGGLAALLAQNVGDVGVLYLLRGDGGGQLPPDEEPGAVAVRQHNEPPLFGQGPQVGQLLPVLEDAKALCLYDNTLHQRRKLDFVVLALHYDGLFHPNHARSLRAASSSLAMSSSKMIRGSSREPFRAMSASSSRCRLSRSTCWGTPRTFCWAFFRRKSLPL